MRLSRGHATGVPTICHERLRADALGEDERGGKSYAEGDGNDSFHIPLFASFDGNTEADTRAKTAISVWEHPLLMPPNELGTLKNKTSPLL